jgi:scyllo-inositol 2-dehydrogenase (NADP+)
LQDSPAELCIVCTPNALHAPQTRACLQADRHVVVEKPFVLDSADGHALIKLAAERHKLLTVYQSKRWDGDFLTLQQLVKSGRLGELHTLISSYDRYRPETRDRWRERDLPGAGIVWDIAPHLIDQALLLFGKPRGVQAWMSCARPGAQAVDRFRLVLDFGEKMAFLHSDCLTVSGGPRMQAHGSRGAWIKFGMDTQEALLRGKKGPETPGWGSDPTPGFLMQGDDTGHEWRADCGVQPGAYQQFYLQMALAIRDRGPVPVTARSALAVVSVIEAAFISAANGKMVLL